MKILYPNSRQARKLLFSKYCPKGLLDGINIPFEEINHKYAETFEAVEKINVMFDGSTVPVFLDLYIIAYDNRFWLALVNYEFVAEEYTDTPDIEVVIRIEDANNGCFTPEQRGQKETVR